MKAVITGSTKGLGRAIAEHLISHGCDLALCARNEQDLIECKKQMLEKHPDREVIIKKADVSSKAELNAFADFVLETWGHVDILINNAGVFLPGEVLSEAEGSLEKMMSTNLYSAYYLSRRFAPGMVSQDKGHIFNICSVASLKAYPNGGSYSISKYAMQGLNDNLRLELQNKGVKVTGVFPGATWSDSWKNVDLPHSRLMEAHDIAIAIKAALDMSPSAVVEEIVLRPQLGDL